MEPTTIEETHISYLFLVGDRVAKLKKPVRLPFLDWSERADREAACHREVELNRRLSPDVYLGVYDLVGPDGTPEDHLVLMRRMPADRRLSTLVRHHDPALDPGLRQLARRIVHFHAEAERSARIDELGGAATVATNWADNLHDLRAATPHLLDPDRVEAVAGMAERYLAGRAPLFAERAAAGMVVDGHGDLLADDIYLLDDGPRILDCLEFSDRLRAVDVLDDVAFLAMDLERLGAPEQARSFIAAYHQVGGDGGPVSLLHHFIAYRAGVRSKIACLRAGAGMAEARTEARTEARRLLTMAEDHLRTARVRLVAVGGLPASGKTTLSTALGEQMSWPVIHSDLVRKRLAGVPPSTDMSAPLRQGIYDAAHTEATYGVMLDEARHHLERGTSVVLDASWTDPKRRAEVEALATTTSSDLVTLWCEAPVEVMLDRLAARGREHSSDATPEITTALAAEHRPWPAAKSIDTATSLDRSLAVASAITDS